MRIISLNTWGGRVTSSFPGFLSRERGMTDIFCFQEVNNKPDARELEEGEREFLFDELTEALPEHQGFFAEQYKGTGIAVFVRKDIPVAREDSICVLQTEEMAEPFFPRPLQHIELSGLNIYNFHGVPKSDKLDTPEREIQTARVLERMAKDSGPKILVGDFNLRPETDAIRRFEQTMRNLVIAGGFSTTRSDLYGTKALQPYADYAFVTPDVAVKEFTVLDDVVSDHLPLLLEIEAAI